MIEQFRFLQGGFAACGRRVTFWTARKSPKNRWGAGSGWTLRVHIRRPPRTPITGVTPWSRQNPSGAQNLSGFSPFNPGHRALGVQKFSRRGSTPAPEFTEPTRPICRGGTQGRPRAAEVVGPSGKAGRFPHFVGAGVLTRPRPSTPAGQRYPDPPRPAWGGWGPHRRWGAGAPGRAPSIEGRCPPRRCGPRTHRCTGYSMGSFCLASWRSAPNSS